MLSRREAATLLAALQFWNEEIVPRGRTITRPYFRTVGCDRVTPLNRRELDRLSARLKTHLQLLDD